MSSNYGCGGCAKSIHAASSLDYNNYYSKNSGRRRNNNCCYDDCVTSMAILKDTVSEKSCCSSDNAHAYAYNVSAAVIPINGAVSFDHVAESSGIVPPGSGGNDSTQFRILYAGTYEFDYIVRGVTRTSGVAGTNPLTFQLLAGGSNVLGSQYISKSNAPADIGLNNIVHGFGTFWVPSNTIIQLHNISGGFADTVDLIVVPTGGIGSPLAVNASLRIVRTC